MEVEVGIIIRPIVCEGQLWQFIKHSSTSTLGNCHRAHMSSETSRSAILHQSAHGTCPYIPKAVTQCSSPISLYSIPGVSWGELGRLPVRGIVWEGNSVLWRNLYLLVWECRFVPEDRENHNLNSLPQEVLTLWMMSQAAASQFDIVLVFFFSPRDVFSYFFLNWLCWGMIHIPHIQSFTVYGSVAFGIFTELCILHHRLI